jgi:hypothetical protein
MEMARIVLRSVAGALMLQLPIVVGPDPYVVQVPDGGRWAQEFYDSIHPATPVVWVTTLIRAYEQPHGLGSDVPGALGEDALQHMVGLRVRGLYMQLLESLFAHFFANAQCPAVPQAWLSKYRPTHLRQLVGHLANDSWQVPEGVPVLAHSREFVTWLFGIEQMGELDQVERTAETDAVMETLTRLARDYTSPGFDKEYNAAKHGVRAMPAPFSITLSQSGSGASATLGATHASHFLVEDRGAGPARHYFTLRRRSQAWHPERGLKTSQLAAWLLHNLIQALRSPGPRRGFASLRNKDLRVLDGLIQRLQHWESGMGLDVPDEPVSREGARQGAAELNAPFLDFIRNRAEQVAEYRRRREGSGGEE